MSATDDGWRIPPPDDDGEPDYYVDSQTRIETDAWIIWRCCRLARQMDYGGHRTTARQQAVEKAARMAYIRSYYKLAEVQKWSGGLPLQLLASIECPQYWRASRQLVWVMGEIGRPSPIHYTLRDQLRRAIHKWNETRREVAVAVYIDEQDMGGDKG